MSLIYPLILAGGSGTRLWPRSREKSPKQFIPLINGKSLFQETCVRFKDTSLFASLTIITHEEHRFLVRDQLLELGITNASIVTEPIAKNTLAACLAGAYSIEKKAGNVPILIAPSDHIIGEEHHLFEALRRALPHVLGGSMCIFGISPTSPHTGYGYIRKGKKIDEEIYVPTMFVEKPDKEKAAVLIAEDAVWNSGMYFCRIQTLEEEARLYTKEIQDILTTYFSKNPQEKNNFLMIPKEVYSPIVPISIDKGITEFTKKIIVATLPIIWSDLGSWSSLHDHFEKTDDGNVLRGDIVALDTKNSYIESTSRLVSVVGIENTGVIETADAVLVFPLNQSESIKKIVATLSENNRQELIVHTNVHRPWGHYHVLSNDTNHQAKKITVLPGAELSLQRHRQRAEHWIVIQGIATVTKDSDVFLLKKNESTFIPMGTIHRLQNKHDEVLVLIEIQTGEYFGEDDIERFSDTYGRI
jgi:mannose-1-phosphate guanylyltransferase/mannose-6-phosphate isomerase